MSLLELLLLIAATWQVYREQPAERAAWRASFFRFAYKNSSLSMKKLWSPSSSILFLLLPVITTCAFSHCLDFSCCGFEWGVQIGLGCVLLLHRNLWRRFKESLVLLEDVGRFITATCTRPVWLSLVKYVLVCNTSSELFSLNHCLNLTTYISFSWAGSTKGPHRDRLQQVYSTISAELLVGGTVLTRFFWLLMIYLGFYFNKVSLFACYNHHNGSSKLSWP